MEPVMAPPKDLLAFETSEVSFFGEAYQLFPHAGVSLDDVQFEAEVLAAVAQVEVRYLYNDQLHTVAPVSVDDVAKKVSERQKALGGALEQAHRDYMSRKFQLDELVKRMGQMSRVLTQIVRERREKMLKELRDSKLKLQTDLSNAEKQLATAVRDGSNETVLVVAKALVKLKEERDVVEERILCIERGIRQEALPPKYGLGHEYQ